MKLIRSFDNMDIIRNMKLHLCWKPVLGKQILK